MCVSTGSALGEPGGTEDSLGRGKLHREGMYNDNPWSSVTWSSKQASLKLGL